MLGILSFRHHGGFETTDLQLNVAYCLSREQGRRTKFSHPYLANSFVRLPSQPVLNAAWKLKPRWGHLVQYSTAKNRPG